MTKTFRPLTCQATIVVSPVPHVSFRQSQMQPPSQPKLTGLLLSGGIDSSVLLATLLQEDWQITPFYVQMGCVWENEEQLAVRKFMAQVATANLGKLVVFDMPLADLYGQHWSMTGDHAPDDLSPDEAVFLFGRNPLLLMKPVLWCHLHGIPRLALATLAANPFDDATPAFFSQFETMLHTAVGARLEITRPFEQMSKKQVLELGRELPLELTFSCIAPIEGKHCGRCNKCAERRRGFAALSLEDRTCYYASESNTLHNRS